MNGVTPATDDKGFKFNGKQFHIGAWGDDGNYNIALVAERVAGAGVYAGAGAHQTWEFVHLFDAALWKFQNPTATPEQVMQQFVAEANQKYAAYTGGSNELPPMPSDFLLALQWLCKYKVQFRPETNQIVMV